MPEVTLLQTVWFVIWGLLWAIYFVLDGFDLGAGMLMPFLARGDRERRQVFQAIGPFWDGNEVWLITAGGVTFAAFPGAYAVMFSTLYSPLMLILFGLIIRGATIAFRDETESAVARKLCDLGFFVGSFVPALLLGVTFANLFKGIPLTAEKTFQGNILTLFNPYGLLGGGFFLCLFLQHGAIWLAIKTTGDLQKRSVRAAGWIWVPAVLAGLAFLYMSNETTVLYVNYLAHPALFLIPALTVTALLYVRYCMAKNQWVAAWWSSAAVILSATLFGVVGMFPNILFSSLNGMWSVTIQDAASSALTLKIMLAVVLVFVPLVIFYQAWVYRLFKGQLEEGDGIY